MNSNYIVVFNDKKRGEVSAALLCEQINQGALIISAVAAGDAVHYLIANPPQNPTGFPPELTDEDAQIIRDNLDATHGEKKHE
jgi:hypothetical protein